MAKFLDLDTVRKPVGAFQLNGNSYEIWPLRIEQIINITALEAEDNSTLPQDQQFQRLVDGLREAIPTCPREELLTMDMMQFNALAAWIQTVQREGQAEKNSEPPPTLQPATETAA